MTAIFARSCAEIRLFEFSGGSTSPLTIQYRFCSTSPTEVPLRDQLASKRILQNREPFGPSTAI